MGFHYDVTVAWGDCDEMGIVFYPNYYYWFDTTFHAFMRQRGVSQRAIRERFGALGTPLVDTGARYRAPVRYDDPIRIVAEIESWSTRSFRLRYTVLRDGDTVAVEGHEVRAWVVAGPDGSFKAGTIPDGFKEALA